MGTIGNAFLSCDLALVLLLQEGNDSADKKPSEAPREAGLVTPTKKPDIVEEVSEVEEASMALVLMAVPLEEPDRMMTEEEMEDELLELDVMMLHPIIVAFRSYEAVDRKIEDNVASALLTIKQQKDFYESVPESAFAPKKGYEETCSVVPERGSINIMRSSYITCGNELSKTLPIDAFASRKGGVRNPSSGRDAGLWNYLPTIPPSAIRVFHVEYTEKAIEELAKCKMLSKYLCENALASNANKAILVNPQAALYCFATNYPARLLSRCAIALSKGEEDPQKIAYSLAWDTLEGSHRAESTKTILRNL